MGSYIGDPHNPPPPPSHASHQHSSPEHHGEPRRFFDAYPMPENPRRTFDAYPPPARHTGSPRALDHLLPSRSPYSSGGESSSSSHQHSSTRQSTARREDGDPDPPIPRFTTPPRRAQLLAMAREGSSSHGHAADAHDRKGKGRWSSWKKFSKG